MSKNKTSPQKSFCLCHWASSLIRAGPSSLKHEALSWLWSLGGVVSAKWAWTKLHVLERTVEWSELLLDVRVTPWRLQEAAWLGKTIHVSQEVCQTGSKLLGSWPSCLKEEGHLVRWALGPVLEKGWWEVLVSRQGESQNEAFKGDRTLVPKL